MSRRVRIIETADGSFFFKYRGACSKPTRYAEELAAQIEAVTDSAGESYHFRGLVDDEDLCDLKLHFALGVGAERIRLRELARGLPQAVYDAHA